MIDWWAVAADPRRILVGAMEVLSGNFEIFDSQRTLEIMGLWEDSQREQSDRHRWRMRRPLCLEGVAASGTLPEVQPPRRICDTDFPTADPEVTVTRDALYWDGLYSQNSIRSWITILTVTDWLSEYAESGLDNVKPFNTMKKVTVRTIKMRPETAYTLRYASKMDRSMPSLERLADEGREVAMNWLSRWRTQGDAFAKYPADARYDPQETTLTGWPPPSGAAPASVR